ncbi:MAG TPA: SDR family oxidoreductase [Tepidisphaeraceae bacterium]|nr:SDR family oxidoreductase [Tepidisphaeraceae bacterium]
MHAPVAIIAGAGRGIGRAIALELGNRGYRLALASRNQKELEAVAAQAKTAIAVVADVTRVDDVQMLVDKTLASFGRIDVVVNNVGLAPVAKVDELSIEQWHAVINTNLSSAFYLARAAWGTFKEQHSGCIVNISSMASRDPLPGFLAYGAAKAGLNLMSLVLAREGAEHGIRSYAIAPGAVETSMFRRMVSKEKWPVEKTLDPADVARVVAQCVDGDLKYTSGEVIFLSKTL